MKAFFKRILPLLILPFLTGCVNSARVVSDNSTAVASIQNMSSTQIYFSCEKSQGNTTYQFKVTEKHDLNINTEVTLAAGTIGFVFTDENNKELYNNTLTESTNFAIPLENYGTYKVRVTYEAFKGKYKINWEKK